jgi:hypothetical protein
MIGKSDGSSPIWSPATHPFVDFYDWTRMCIEEISGASTAAGIRRAASGVCHACFSLRPRIAYSVALEKIIVSPSDFSSDLLSNFPR